MGRFESVGHCARETELGWTQDHVERKTDGAGGGGGGNGIGWVAGKEFV